jgi:hypothetical protein
MRLLGHGAALFLLRLPPIIWSSAGSPGPAGTAAQAWAMLAPARGRAALRPLSGPGLLIDLQWRAPSPPRCSGLTRRSGLARDRAQDDSITGSGRFNQDQDDSDYHLLRVWPAASSCRLVGPPRPPERPGGRRVCRVPGARHRARRMSTRSVTVRDRP